MGIGRPARRGPRRRPGRPDRRTRNRAPAGPAHQRNCGACHPWLYQVEHSRQPADPRRDPTRPALRPARPHRGRVHPRRSAAARRHVQPPGNRGDLRRQERHLAGSRTAPARRTGPPGHHRPPADTHRQPHRGAAESGQRASRQPARRLVRRQRQPLGPVTPAQTQRCHAHLHGLRAHRRSRNSPERQPGPNHHRTRSRLAATARTARRHRDTGPRRPQAGSTRWPSTAPRSPSGSSQPGPPPGTPRRPSTSPSSSGHRADASKAPQPIRCAPRPQGGAARRQAAGGYLEEVSCESEC